MKWSKTLVFMLVLMIAYAPYASAKMFGQELCKTEGYHCVRVKRGQSWSRLFPSIHDRNIAMRVNRMNSDIWPGLVIAVPDNIETVDIMDLSPFPQQIDAPHERQIIVDPSVNAWAAYDADGTLIKWGPAAAGADYCKDVNEPCRTHQGSFRVFSLGSSDCISHKFPLPRGGAPMPYCMYFNEGQALHGEPFGVPGYNASHGCVRLYLSDAEWLRYDFIEGPNPNNHYKGTRVIVKSYGAES